MNFSSNPAFQDKTPQNQFLSEEVKAQQNLISASSSPSQNTSDKTITTKRMSITLAGDIVEYLEKWAKMEHISLNEIIRRSVATEIFLQKEIRSGSKLLIHRKNDEIAEIIFR